MATKTGLLSDVQVRAWVKAGEAVAKSDGGGLTFTLSKAGTASWVLRYSHGGKQREVTLGRYPDVSLKKARELAAERRVEVMQGRDVAAEKQARKIAEAAPDTVKGLAEEFYERTVLGRIKRPEHVRLRLDNDIIRALGRKRVTEVQPADIDHMITQVLERGSPVMANRVLALTKEVFDYAVRRHWITANPASAFRRKDAGGAEVGRDRALSDGEITKLIKALDGAGVGFRPYALAVRLLLLTGVRRLELIEAAWAEFDLEAGVWVLPVARQKSSERKGARDFEIPLTSNAVAWLRELKTLGCGSEFVFPAKRRVKRQTLAGNTLNWALGAVDHGCEVFSVHDLRRTCRTKLAALGIAPHVAERYLNHKLPGVIGIYDQHDYFVERREAAERLAAKLSALEKGETFNVVALRGAA